MEDATVPPPAPPRGRGARSATGWSRRPARFFRDQHLRRVQTIVGICVGVVSLAGGIYSFIRTPSPSGEGELVAIVQDAAGERAVQDAAIEVLSDQNALVSSLSPDSSGHVRQHLKEGVYVVRVSHPSYAAESRKIEVQARRTVQLRVNLRAGSSAPLDRARGAIGSGARGVWEKLGFGGNRPAK